MKKLILLLFLSVIYSCQLKQYDTYKESNSVTTDNIDTLNIERIKIKTH